MKDAPLNPATDSMGLRLVILLALLTALDAMAIDMYLPGMPAIAADFGVTDGRIQQTLAVFLAGLAIGQGLYGPVLDRFGRRLPLILGLGIFVAGSVLAAIAPSVEWLMAARFLQAIGAAGGLVAPRAIVADRCSLQASARIYSLLMQVMMIAPIVAPLLGGYVLAHGSWRLIFWVLAGLGVIGLLWSIASLPDSLPRAQRVPLSLINTLSAYGRQTRRPAFLAYTLAGGFILGSLFTYISASAFVFTQHYGLTPTQFSYLFAANSVALVLGGALSNMALSVWANPQRITLVGVALHVLAGLSLFMLIQTDLAGLISYGLLLGLAIGALGLVFGNLTALTMGDAGKQTGIASALMGVLQYLLSAVIGYVVSLAPQGAGLLPITIATCGCLAALMTVIGGRAAERAPTQAEPELGR
ncbi:multidrug effflux MFS transporter [Stutzerimonas zhaodongensis]|uniref:multidrug effflux MFS transporter n=1 Tax=Stutzerimonas TaxID=2901164 RepID=UPI00388FA650